MHEGEARELQRNGRGALPRRPRNPRIPYLRPGSPELAKAVVEAMRKHNSVLLTNHGQVVCGKDFDQAFERAMFFEMACRIIIQSGGNYSVLSTREIEDLDIYVLGKKTK